MFREPGNIWRAWPGHRAVRLLAVITLAAAVLQPRAQDPKLAARALTPQEIHDFALPEGTQVSGGLFTVGIGAPAYLEALVPQGTPVTGVTWEITLAPKNSSAQFAESPLGLGIPTYNPADRAVYAVAGRTLLVPDVVGQFTVQATVATADGPVILTQKVTAAHYVGVGNMTGAAPGFPQCALCHTEKAESWLGTGHATMFTEAIDGLKSSHYGSNCIECHTVGHDTAPAAKNGGFDDVAEQVGWVFPEVLQPGNWLAVPDALKAVSNIQCESCHGPGSEHKGDERKISVSFSSGACAQCHDEGPHHIKNIEWNVSAHASPTRSPSGEGRGSCVGCHTGIGFVEKLKGVPSAEVNTDYEAIGCAACHDPHSGANPHQVRRVADVKLLNGTVVTEGGMGKLCMNCHMSRRNAETYVKQYASHYGPHYSCQTDMLAGTNAIEYGREIPSTAHLYSLEDSCVTCHMQATANDDPLHGKAGGHTFLPKWDGGTPDDQSDDADLVGACVKCHGPVTTLNIARSDYDGDGVFEGIQTEVEGLLHELGVLLPPLGEATVAVTADYTPAQLKAAFNYLFVEEDGSHGIHNPAYAVGILKAAIADLSGAPADDSDGDGLPDAWELETFGSLTEQSGDDDADLDGLSNAFEWRAGANPLSVDTDGDGFFDLAEVHANSDPTKADDTPDNGSMIYHAAEFVFFTQVGKTYQVQAIAELGGAEGWVNLGYPVQGTGEMVQMFISTKDGGKEFYRVVEAQP